MIKIIKKIALIAIVLMVLVGCSRDNPIDLEKVTKNMQTIEIEGCEYLIYSRFTGSYTYSFMSHKGNCRNPIHYRWKYEDKR